MKKNWLISIIISFVLTGCVQEQYKSTLWIRPIDIPNANIVFDTISTGGDAGSEGNNILAFYTISDNSVQTLDLGSGYSLTHPFFLDSGRIIATSKLGYSGLLNDTRSDLMVFSKTHHLRCDKLIGQAFPHGNDVVYIGLGNLYIVNINDCSLQKEIINSEFLSNLQGIYHIGPMSLSENYDFVLLDIDYHLYKISLRDMKLTDYHKVGTVPALSPDQKKVTYLGSDGIHIMDVDGKNDSVVVPFKVYTTEFTFFDGEIMPNPNWDKDSSKIVYHKCYRLEGKTCSDIMDYDIFIYDLITKKETKIIHGGLNPSWNFYK